MDLCGHGIIMANMHVPTDCMILTEVLLDKHDTGWAPSLGFCVTKEKRILKHNKQTSIMSRKLVIYHEL